jgi:hypothetical protein
MLNLYFRKLEREEPRLLFTSEEVNTAFAELLLMRELATQIDDTGVFRALIYKTDEQIEASLERVADAQQSVGLLLVNKSSDGNIEVEKAYIDCADPQTEDRDTRALASVAAKQAQDIPTDEPTWLFLAV